MDGKHGTEARPPHAEGRGKRRPPGRRRTACPHLRRRPGTGWTSWPRRRTGSCMMTTTYVHRSGKSPAPPECAGPPGAGPGNAGKPSARGTGQGDSRAHPAGCRALHPAGGNRRESGRPGSMNGAPPQPEQDSRPLRRWIELYRRAGLPESTCLPGLQGGPGRAGETRGRPPGPPPGPLDMPPPGRTQGSPSPGNAFFPVIRPSAALRRRKKPYIYKEMKKLFS